MRRLESICLEHAIPKRVVAGSVAVSFRRRVKYEKSSVDLEGNVNMRLTPVCDED